MARLRQFAPDPIEVRVGAEARNETGEPVAAPPGAQVATQAHHDEREIGQRLRKSHRSYPLWGRPKVRVAIRCDLEHLWNRPDRRPLFNRLDRPGGGAMGTGVDAFENGQ